MTKSPLRIGVSACFFHPDPDRNLFRGKRLLYAEESMLHYLQRSGALAWLIPTPQESTENQEFLLSQTPTHEPSPYLDAIHGLLLQGGSDMSPRSYGETPLRPEWSGDEPRDLYEMALVRTCLKRKIPILGICRGAQVLNVALGGSLYQDIQTQIPETLPHRDGKKYDRLFHQVHWEPGSGLEKLYAPLRQNSINSIHHQALHRIGKDLVVEARSPKDGIVEAVRFRPKGDPKPPYALGVQWHPEFHHVAMQQNETPSDLLDPVPLMEEFLDAASHYRKFHDQDPT